MASSKSWPVQDAKARFSEMLVACERDGAQIVMPVDAASFRAHARLMRLKPAPAYEDALIGAVAIRHGLTIVTRNIKDFARFDAPVLNPFDTVP